MTVPNLMVSISGEPKSGKSHLACSFPGPILVVSFDLGAKFLLSKFKDKAIDLKEMPMPIYDSLDAKGVGFDKFWREVRYAIYTGVDSNKYQTIVIDTASALWEIIRYGYNEEEGKAVGASGKARTYGEPNARMYGVITKIQISGVNLVLVNYLKDRYENDQNTGKKELDGWKKTEGLVDLVLLNRKIPNPTGAGSVFKTLIKDYRFDHTIDGTELEMTDYDELITILGL